MTALLRRLAIAVGFVVGFVAVAFVVGGAPAPYISNNATINATAADPVPLASPNGTTVSVNDTAEYNLTSPFDDTAVVLNATDGNVTVNGSADTNLTVESIDGQFSKFSDIDTNGSTIRLDIENHPDATIKTADGQLWVNRTMRGTDDLVDFRYGGTVTARTNLTLHADLQANTQYGAFDNVTGTKLGENTTDANGNLTLTNLPHSSHNVSLQSTANVSIRNETPPHGLIDSQSVVFLFYERGEGDNVLIANKTTSNGYINYSDLPTDSTIVARVKTDGYHNRSVFTEPYSNESIYLLDTDVPSYEKIFTLKDSTGTFPAQDTVLIVQRDINLSNTIKWRPVAGDLFGPRGVVVHLQQNKQYRLKLRNVETGDVVVLGRYEAVQAGETALAPRIANVNTSIKSNVSIGFEAYRNDTGKALIVEFEDFDGVTGSVKVEIYETGNESNVLRPDQTYKDVSSLRIKEPLNATEQNTSWTVRVTYVRNGDKEQFVVPVGQGPTDLLPPGFDQVWRTSAGVITLFLTALLFTEISPGIGAIVTTLAAALLWFVGLLTTITSGPALVVALFISGLVHYNDRGVG